MFAVIGDTLDCTNPTTDTSLTKVASDDSAAIDATKKTIKSGVWYEMVLRNRNNIMFKWTQLIQEKQDDFAALDTLDMGKFIPEISGSDIPDSINHFRWTDEDIDTLCGESTPTVALTLLLLAIK